MSEGIHHPGLQCYVLGLTYDFVRETGRLDMEDGSCCDMTGCIELFQAIDPQVTVIQTYSGEAKDTQYLRRKEGGWTAIAHE